MGILLREGTEESTLGSEAKRQKLPKPTVGRKGQVAGEKTTETSGVMEVLSKLRKGGNVTQKRL